MRTPSNRLLVLLALTLAVPIAAADHPQDANQRTREKPVQDARGAQGQGTPARQDPVDEKARQAKERQARDAAQGQRQPDGRQEPQRPPAPATDQERLEQRKANAREQQQKEQEQLEQRKANARAQQQEGAGEQARGAPPAAQREAVEYWAAEMRVHRDRTARLDRLLELATAAKQRERATEISQLITRETKRHEGKLVRIEAGIDPAVLRELQGRLAKSGAGDPQRREAPAGDGARKDPAPVGDQRGALEGARKEAPGGKSDAPPSRPQ